MSEIYVRPMGGLGNQLFQYAVAYGIAQNNSAELIIDNRFFINYGLHGGYRLSNLNISEKCIGAEGCKTFPEWKCKLLTKFPQLTRFTKDFIYDKISSYTNIKNEKVMLLGYWQNECNFHQYKEKLIEKFKPVFIDEDAFKLAEEIKSVNSVIIHVRRGDYINNPIALKNHGVCSLNYYKKSIDTIKKIKGNVVFYVFSDDIDWCKENLLVEVLKQDNCVFISGKSQETDLWLMSCGKNHIIANSSFSWWGAFLSEYADQVVIAPQPWFDIRQRYTNDPALCNWIRLDKH
ncbi:alpha-1,2-fucosyltransferase [Citrobacter sedlakii]|uniref:alpha-1,2-fucosyltransferase n=1 Tax=Citrobacter sedlakii TaxID=67826 RepID=UPI003B434E01